MIDAGLNVHHIRYTTLKYLESMRITDSGPYGRYRYCQSQSASVLYASVYAVLTRSLYNDLDSLSIQNRDEWIEYIKSFQCEDGLFRDPEIDCELASTVMWWGWLHLTFHAVSALTLLGGVCEKKFLCLEQFMDTSNIEKWFEQTKIQRSSFLGIDAHSPLYYVALLQYIRDFHNSKWSNAAINKIIDLINAQIDPLTGFCGTMGRVPKLFDINECVKIGYHLWIFYFYDQVPLLYADKVVDNLLLTQNKLGGFDLSFNSSACDDIDSIDPLCRLLSQSDYRKIDIENSLCAAVPWVLANRNLDGGYVFKRDESFQYGHTKMLSGRNESHMFATWFRSLSLAYIGKSLPSHFLGQFQWHLPKVPGLQFWP